MYRDKSVRWANEMSRDTVTGGHTPIVREHLLVHAFMKRVRN